MEVDHELFPYQIEGAQWLTGKRYALLADEMGLGKTAQVITAADAIGAKSILVLCPASLRLNWVREFEKFSWLERSISVVMKASDSKRLTDTVICSYDLATKTLDQLKRPYDLLICDEAHYLKSYKAERSKTVFRKLLPLAQRAWFISGTPAPNHPAELWNLLHHVGMYRYDYWHFMRQYCEWYEGAFGPVIQGAKTANIPLLKKLLSQIMLRRKKIDVMSQLPAIKFDHIYVEPGPVDEELAFLCDFMAGKHTDVVLRRKLAEQTQAVESVLKVAKPGKDFVNALEHLAGATATLRRYTGISKVKSLAEYLSEKLENGQDKIVVFCMHTDVIQGLFERLKKYHPVTLYGETPADKRQRHIDRFQNDPSCRLFIGQVVAAGTGITLTSANYVVFAEYSWVPAENAQAAMRCHRIGQTRNVQVDFVALRGSIDEQITKVVKRKTRDLTQIFD